MNQAIRLLLAAVNVMLSVQGQLYRVGGSVTITRHNGYTFIALQETTNAADYRGGVNPPIVNMAGQ